MNEEMRKEFEEWFCNEYLHGVGIPNYGCSTTNAAWKAWQASREAMKLAELRLKYASQYDNESTHLKSDAELYKKALLQHYKDAE
jgi:protoheme ferro-lyase